jgi:hypothetical protein
MTKAKIYYDSDADLALLHGKRIAIHRLRQPRQRSGTEYA